MIHSLMSPFIVSVFLLLFIISDSTHRAHAQPLFEFVGCVEDSSTIGDVRNGGAQSSPPSGGWTVQSCIERAESLGKPYASLRNAGQDCYAHNKLFSKGSTFLVDASKCSTTCTGGLSCGGPGPDYLYFSVYFLTQYTAGPAATDYGTFGAGSPSRTIANSFLSTADQAASIGSITEISIAFCGGLPSGSATLSSSFSFLVLGRTNTGYDTMEQKITKDLTITSATGYQTFTLDNPLPIQAGQRLAMYFTTSTLRICATTSDGKYSYKDGEITQYKDDLQYLGNSRLAYRFKIAAKIGQVFAKLIDFRIETGPNTYTSLTGPTTDAPMTYTYTAALTDTSFTFSPLIPDPNRASYTTNIGSLTNVAISSGITTILLDITSSDASITRRYTIAISKAPALSSIVVTNTITGAGIFPGATPFSYSKTSYDTITLPSWVNRITINATDKDGPNTGNWVRVYIPFLHDEFTLSPAAPSFPVPCSDIAKSYEVRISNRTTNLVTAYSVWLKRPYSAELLSFKTNPSTAITIQPSVYRYITQVPYSASSVTYTASAEDEAATINYRFRSDVQGTTLNSGVAITDSNVGIGSNTLVTTVFGSDGSALKSEYTFIIQRTPILDYMTIRSGSALSLSPSFNSYVTEYTATATPSQRVISIDCILPSALSGKGISIQWCRETSNGVCILQSTFSSLNLITGANTVRVNVTTTDQVFLIYTVTITRQQTSLLSNIAANSTTAVPLSFTRAFSSSVLSYSLVLPSSINAIILGTSSYDDFATIQIKINKQNSGSPFVANDGKTLEISIGAGTTTMELVVTTALAPVSSSTYTITITRAAQLNSLSIQNAADNTELSLIPSFSPSVHWYSLSVVHSISAVTVFADSSDSVTLGCKIDGTTVANPSSPININYGVNIITITLTPDDNTITSVAVYSVNITRSPAPFTTTTTTTTPSTTTTTTKTTTSTTTTPITTTTTSTTTTPTKTTSTTTSTSTSTSSTTTSSSTSTTSSTRTTPTTSTTTTTTTTPSATTSSRTSSTSSSTTTTPSTTESTKTTTTGTSTTSTTPSSTTSTTTTTTTTTTPTTVSSTTSPTTTTPPVPGSISIFVTLSPKNESVIVDFSLLRKTVENAIIVSLNITSERLSVGEPSKDDKGDILIPITINPPSSISNNKLPPSALVEVLKQQIASNDSPLKPISNDYSAGVGVAKYCPSTGKSIPESSYCPEITVSDSSNRGLAIGLSIGLIFGFLFIGAGLFYYYYRRRTESNKVNEVKAFDDITTTDTNTTATNDPIHRQVELQNTNNNNNNTLEGYSNKGNQKPSISPIHRNGSDTMV